MEPPGPHVRRGPSAAHAGDLTQGAGAGLGLGWVRRAAVAGAAVLALTATGEVLLLGVLLGAAGGSVVAGAAAVGAVLALAVRWGSTALDAVAGAQAVLGPGGVVGPVAAVVSCWCAAGALVLASPGRWAPLAFGPAAALAVAGPAIGDATDLAVRAGAAVAGTVVAAVAGARVPRAVAGPAALVLAAGALVAAGLA